MDTSTVQALAAVTAYGVAAFLAYVALYRWAPTHVADDKPAAVIAAFLWWLTFTLAVAGWVCRTLDAKAARLARVGRPAPADPLGPPNIIVRGGVRYEPAPMPTGPTPGPGFRPPTMALDAFPPERDDPPTGPLTIPTGPGRWVPDPLPRDPVTGKLLPR